MVRDIHLPQPFLTVNDLARWPRMQLMRHPWLFSAVQTGLGYVDRWRSRRRLRDTVFELGQICSTTVLEALEPISVEYAPQWGSHAISPNSIPTLPGFTKHELKVPRLGQEDEMATAAIERMIAQVIADLNL